MWGGPRLGLPGAAIGANSALASHNKHGRPASYATSYTAPAGNSATGNNYQFECSPATAAATPTARAGRPGPAAPPPRVVFNYTSAGIRGPIPTGPPGPRWYAACVQRNLRATYCHSDGNGGNGYNTTFTWTDTGTLRCTGCHGDAQTPDRLLTTGYHQKHVNKAASPAIGNTFGCVECHASTVSSNATLPTSASTLNKFKEYSGAKAGRIARAARDCATSYCHSSGQAIPAYRTPQNWDVPAPATAATAATAPRPALRRRLHRPVRRAELHQLQLGEPQLLQLPLGQAHCRRRRLRPVPRQHRHRRLHPGQLRLLAPPTSTACATSTSTPPIARSARVPATTRPPRPAPASSATATAGPPPPTPTSGGARP